MYENTQTADITGRTVRRVTRRDVAEAIGVSVATVSNGLNPRKGIRINQQTQEQVLKVAKQLGYRRNFGGRGLATGKTWTVGVLQSAYGTINYNFYQSILKGAMEALDVDDYSLLVMSRSENFRYMRLVEQGRLDGVFCLQSDLDTTHIKRLVDSGIPTVVVNKGYSAKSSAAVGCVHSDHRRMMREMVDEFVSRRCRTILAINGQLIGDANKQMFDGFVEATEEYRQKGVVGTALIGSYEDTATQVRSIFQAGHHYDGIFIDGMCWADILIKEAHQAGLTPGRDFHLITSEVMLGQTSQSREELSAYTQDGEAMGREAWRLLKQLIDGEAKDRTVLVPYHREPVRADTPGEAGVK